VRPVRFEFSPTFTIHFPVHRVCVNDVDCRADEAVPPDPKELPVQCLLLLDEFTAIGRIDIPAHSIAFIAGYNLRLVAIVQSISQLYGTYGARKSRNLVANHALRCVFAPTDLRDARDISEILGMKTLQSIQETRSRSRLSSRRSVTERLVEQQRPLMLPQELRTLPAHQQLLLLHGVPSILAEKIRYFDDPLLAARASSA
jgi:type IV secretion system protein VirD4